MHSTPRALVVVCCTVIVFVFVITSVLAELQSSSTRSSVLIGLFDTCRIISWPWLVVEELVFQIPMKDSNCLDMFLHGSASLIHSARFKSSLYSKDIFTEDWLTSGYNWTFTFKSPSDWFLMHDVMATKITSASSKQQCNKLSWDRPPLEIIHPNTPNDILQTKDKNMVDIALVNGFWATPTWSEDNRLAELYVFFASLAHHQSASCTIRLQLFVRSMAEYDVIQTILQMPLFVTFYQHIVVYIVSDLYMTFVWTPTITSVRPLYLLEPTKKLVIPSILDRNVHDVIILDTDAVILDDVCTMAREFRDLSTIFAMAPELSSYYTAEKETYSIGKIENKHLPDRYRGVNSGVIYCNVDRLRLQTNFEQTLRQSIAQFVFDIHVDYHKSVEQQLYKLFELSDQTVYNYIFRYHREWLTVLPMELNVQLFVLRDVPNMKRHDLCLASPLSNIRILHGNAQYFRWKKEGLIRNLIWKPFLDGAAAAFKQSTAPIVFGDADISTIHFKELARLLLYDACQ